MLNPFLLRFESRPVIEIQCNVNRMRPGVRMIIAGFWVTSVERGLVFPEVSESQEIYKPIRGTFPCGKAETLLVKHNTINTVEVYSGDQNLIRKML